MKFVCLNWVAMIGILSFLGACGGESMSGDDSQDISQDETQDVSDTTTPSEPEAVCGNGTVEDGESCDDGNADETDDCLTTCESASCGDGFVHAGVETCDDGNSTTYDGCGNCEPSYNAKSDGTVIDVPEQLMWTRCLQPARWNSGCSGSAEDYRYCGSNDNSCNSGIDEGILGGGGSSSAWEACSDFSFAGYTDWRLPTKEELGGLVECSSGYNTNTNSDEICLDEGFSQSTLPSIFSHLEGPEVWSSSSKNSGDAWSVGFMRGYYQGFFKRTPKKVVCVRDNVEQVEESTDETGVSEEFGASCNSSADCQAPTDFCTMGTNYCTTQCENKQACLDAGADPSWTCMAVFACDLQSWCGPSSELAEGSIVECD